MAYLQESLSASQLQYQLQKTADFLHLTRSHEFSMAAFNFEVKCTQNSSKAKVSVLDTGIIIFEPLNHTSSKDIVLSSAVHGNETAPIEICNELIKQLILGKLHLENRTLFLFGNPPAINIGHRFVEENLNRLFSGAHSQGSSLHKGQGEVLINKEHHRALLLENTVKIFYENNNYKERNSERFHYDLHTAIRGSKNDKFAVYPFRHNKSWVKEQLQFMLACGINTILFSNSPTTTFSYFSSNKFGAHAFTVELGKVKPFGENDMTNFAGVIGSLTALISGQPLALAEYNKEDFSFFAIDQIIDRHSDDFKFHFSDDVENFTDFAIGTVIATDGEQEIKTQKAGEAIIFPNANVAIGQRALLTVIPVEVNPE
ncbi:succinylglutamate desuccinylase [Candidatus Colwellia aromaticivorans]|uniref:succinylglutamate desuccinylase n=1 Tax=Candidatus Colwellia aromaticivorans TaxID=2267621 RepID=UPI000DF17924|nr:succinylglutamate desuccinylase [Candidatus Colwellia aromaticivorans]